MTMKNLFPVIILIVTVTGCKSPKPSDSEQGQAAMPEFSLVEVWRTDTLLQTCESVLYDPQKQLLYVSCINGAPTEQDGNGYIATVNTNGTIRTLKWVDGLDAPKGMGIHEGLLFVTDINELVVIDIEKAEISERFPVTGASFLNDVAVGPDGTVYFTDSDTGIIWTFKEGELDNWISGGLSRPNGLFVEEDRVLLTSSASEDLKIIDRSTAEMESVTVGIGRGDGVEYTGMEGYYLTSSWSGEVFLIYPDFSKVSLLKTSDQEINSADIGFNIGEQIVYVPTFFDNRVVAYRLTEKNTGHH